MHKDKLSIITIFCRFSIPVPPACTDLRVLSSLLSLLTLGCSGVADKPQYFPVLSCARKWLQIERSSPLLLKTGD